MKVQFLSKNYQVRQSRAGEMTLKVIKDISPISLFPLPTSTNGLQSQSNSKVQDNCWNVHHHLCIEEAGRKVRREGKVCVYLKIISKSRIKQLLLICHQSNQSREYIQWQERLKSTVYYLKDCHILQSEVIIAAEEKIKGYLCRQIKVSVKVFSAVILHFYCPSIFFQITPIYCFLNQHVVIGLTLKSLGFTS